MTNARALLSQLPLTVLMGRTVRNALWKRDDARPAAIQAAPAMGHAEAVAAAAGTDGQMVDKPASESTADGPPAPAWKPEDFDIYHQYPPHVFYTFRDRDALFRDAVTAYSNVPVEDEASGLYSDPIRILQFYQLISAANQLPEGDYVEFGSHPGFSTRVIHRFMDPGRMLFAFEGFDERDISVERGVYETEWTAGSFAPTSVQHVATYVGDGV